MISQSAKYALRAMSFVAGSSGDRPVLARVIAKETDIPRNFLSKIMHRLVQASYLSSTRGTNGGFKLTKDPRDITLLEIVSLFMNVQDFKRCIMGLPRCIGGCKLHDKQKHITRQFLDMLEVTTVADVA